MEILESAGAWRKDFEAGWLDHLKRTGEVDWKLYHYGRNRAAVVAPGVEPRDSRLLLVSTAGAYLARDQEPFDAANDYGDYSVRTFPIDTPYDALAYAHDHYDHAARRQDPRVNLPLSYLREMSEKGEVGSLAENVVSFAGYQPDAGAVLDTLIPEILRLAEEQGAQAALLVPV